MKPVIFIGIDPGVQTGFAVWNKTHKKFDMICTLSIHKAMSEVKNHVELFESSEIHVRFEDARQRKWFGKSSTEVLQGAGSIKRDCKIWEDFLTDLGISFEMVSPKNNMTKLKADVFNRMTGWTGKTSEHARDAAMLIFSK